MLLKNGGGRRGCPGLGALACTPGWPCAWPCGCGCGCECAWVSVWGMKVSKKSMKAGKLGGDDSRMVGLPPSPAGAAMDPCRGPCRLGGDVPRGRKKAPALWPLREGEEPPGRDGVVAGQAPADMGRAGREGSQPSAMWGAVGAVVGAVLLALGCAPAPALRIACPSEDRRACVRAEGGDWPGSGATRGIATPRASGSPMASSEKGPDPGRLARKLSGE